jgi:hypothetical protein
MFVIRESHLEPLELRCWARGGRATLRSLDGADGRHRRLVPQIEILKFSPDIGQTSGAHQTDAATLRGSCLFLRAGIGTARALPEGPQGGNLGAVDPISLVPRPDRRVTPDRRRFARGGRRIGDRGGRVSTGPCDSCGSRGTLQWVAVSQYFDEYRCRHCRCRVFAAR